MTEAIEWKLPPKPGTTPIPDGHVRLYHQTDEKSLGSIRRNGLMLRHARGIEGPRAIYADDQGFYGKPGKVPTVEFHVPQERWDRPFVKGDVEPKDIIAIHRPWHSHARYAENTPEVINNILAGEHDSLLGDPQYGKMVSYIKHKFGSKVNEAGRAKVGGESGINGYEYKGGQFLPSTDAPPGTWRVKQKGKNRLVSTKQWLVEPGKLEESPSPYARAIFQIIRAIVKDDNGVLSVIDNPAAVDYYGRGLCEGRYDVEELVDMYNKGMRWVEIIPPDVEIIAKG